MAAEIENELTLTDCVSIVRRRWLLILTTFLVSIFVIIVTAFFLPPVYKSIGFVTIESPVIAKALIGNDASATRYVDEHLDKVRQKVLSRSNLVSINKKYMLYPAITKPSWVAEAVQRNIKFKRETKSANGNEWSGQVTVGFSLEVESPDADKTFKIANDIISQLLEENVKDRTQRATETISFFTAELKALQNELDAVENKVATYKLKHSNSLPEHQQMHLTTLEELKSTLKGLDLEHQRTREELRYLDVELTTANATINNADLNDATSAVSELDKAKEELERSMVLYKETHPTIRALKRKVDLLEKTQKPPTKKKQKVNVAAELAIAKIRSQTESAQSRLSAIAQEKRFTRAKIERIRSQIISIPQVERGLSGLLRDYENVKNKYDDVRSKQVNAKIAEGLEVSNKAERLVLSESPEYPQYKENISKSKLIALGFPISFAIGLGLAFLLEFFDKRVRRQSVLTALIKAKPLAVIPYISTQAELNQKKALVKAVYILVATLVCFSIVLVLINFLITPLGPHLALLLEFLR